MPYFHLVFTLPNIFNELALQNKKVVYGILFKAAAETLKEVAANPKHLGAEIGFLLVLHSWGQNLMLHPHVHCVAPAGGISPDGSRWIDCRQDFFLPVRVLSRVFRGKFIHYLRQARDDGALRYYGKLQQLNTPEAFEALLDAAVRSDWVVFAKRPFGGPRQVLAYLARYTHRVAISNHRLVSMQDGRVTFRWKDYADGHLQKTMTLDACEFIRRFLLHVLPPGFMRIRHYGFLANRFRSEKLALCRQLLGSSDQEVTQQPASDQPSEQISPEEPTVVCPACQKGRMIIIETLPPEGRRQRPRRPFLLSRRCAAAWDTS